MVFECPEQKALGRIFSGTHKESLTFGKHFVEGAQSPLCLKFRLNMDAALSLVQL